MLKRVLFMFALCFLSSPAWAQKFERCGCACGKVLPPPCGDEDCKRACGITDPIQKDFPVEQMPSVLPFHVQKYAAAKEAYDRGDGDTAFREAQQAVNANRCYAPARALFGDLLIRYGSGVMCTTGSEQQPCDEAGAFELMFAAVGDPSCAHMEGMTPAESAQLEARAQPLYDAAHDKRNRREGKRDLAACEALLKQGDAPAAEEKCRNAAQEFRLARPTKEDWDYALAYDGLAQALEARGDISGAIDALEAAQKTPNGVFYAMTPLGNIRQEKIDRLKRKAGYCQVVLNNNTYGTLGLYINDSTVSACEALGQPKPPPGYNGPMASPPYPTFCTAHVREGTYTLSAKSPDGEFFTRASGPVWCPKGEVRYWTVNP